MQIISIPPPARWCILLAPPPPPPPKCTSHFFIDNGLLTNGMCFITVGALPRGGHKGKKIQILRCKVKNISIFRARQIT